MNKVWLMLVEEDYFYDEKFTRVLCFSDKRSAKEYFEVFVQAMLIDLENDYDADDEFKFEDDIDIDYYSDNTGVCLYMEDAYNIDIHLEEQEVITIK